MCSSYLAIYSNGNVPFVFRANDLMLSCLGLLVFIRPNLQLA